MAFKCGLNAQSCSELPQAVCDWCITSVTQRDHCMAWSLGQWCGACNRAASDLNRSLRPQYLSPTAFRLVQVLGLSMGRRDRSYSPEPSNKRVRPSHRSSPRSPSPTRRNRPNDRSRYDDRRDRDRDRERDRDRDRDRRDPGEQCNVLASLS